MRQMGTLVREDINYKYIRYSREDGVLRFPKPKRVRELMGAFGKDNFLDLLEPETKSRLLLLRGEGEDSHEI